MRERVNEYMNWRLPTLIGLLYLLAVILSFFGMVEADNIWGEPSLPLTVFGLIFLCLGLPASIVFGYTFYGALILLLAQSIIVGITVTIILKTIRKKIASNKAFQAIGDKSPQPER